MSERKIDFSDYKVGDRVWSIVKQEWVEITRKDEDGEDWLFKLSDGYWITKHGSTQITGKPLYFPNAFEIPDEAYRRPLPEIAVDTPIWVRDDEAEIWRPRHFKAWEEDGVRVFYSGGTSHTTDRTAFYSEWSLTNPENDG